MTILHPARHTVKPRRPFAEGLEPVHVGVVGPLHSAPLPPDTRIISGPGEAIPPCGRRVDHRDSTQAEARSIDSSWRTDVTALLRSLGYPPAIVRVALEHLRRHGRAGGCPGLDLSDVPVVTEVYSRHHPAQPGESRPLPTPRPSEPSLDDRRWWAEECERLAAEDRRYDHWGRDSYATEAVARGLIPVDLAEALADGRHRCR